MINLKGKFIATVNISSHIYHDIGPLRELISYEILQHMIQANEDIPGITNFLSSSVNTLQRLLST